MLNKYKLVEIEDLHEEEYSGPVYDLEVQGDHSYNIDGVIVHNSACTTRLQAGVGYPQFSAIVECANRAHGLKGHIISDGGCVVPGDVGKAFGAGADFVMLGGMLAGHTENTEYTKTDSNGKITAVYYGMSSDTAMEKYYGEVADYRSSEGRTLQIPFKGIIDKTIKSILGGLRSTCTYIGAENIKAIPKCANFIKVNRQVNNPFGGNNE